MGPWGQPSGTRRFRTDGKHAHVTRDRRALPSPPATPCRSTIPLRQEQQSLGVASCGESDCLPVPTPFFLFLSPFRLHVLEAPVVLPGSRHLALHLPFPPQPSLLSPPSSPLAVPQQLGQLRPVVAAEPSGKLLGDRGVSGGCCVIWLVRLCCSASLLPETGHTPSLGSKWAPVLPSTTAPGPAPPL